MTEGCGCHIGRVTPVPRSYRHNEVMVLGAFAQAVIDLRAILLFVDANRFVGGYAPVESRFDQRAYDAARAAVRAARMLELREEYR